MNRGEIWNIEYPLPERENSEPYGHGPAVIVSSDAFNHSGIRTIMIAAITSNLRLARAPGNLLVLADATTGLREDSVVNVSQVLVVDKSRLSGKRGMLDEAGLELLNVGLKTVFDLT